MAHQDEVAEFARVRSRFVALIGEGIQLIHVGAMPQPDRRRVCLCVSVPLTVVSPSFVVIVLRTPIARRLLCTLRAILLTSFVMIPS